MSFGKFLAALILTCAIAAGFGMYYLQVYAYYEEVPTEVAGQVLLTSVKTGEPEAIDASNAQAIDANSSPIRYRSCFETTSSVAMLTETYAMTDKAVPLVAPGWFECFDADQLGEDLESGAAIAFMGQEHIVYGIDRMVAIYPDGRGFAWNQLNHCGEVVFKGEPTPEGCPEPPVKDKPE